MQRVSTEEEFKKLYFDRQKASVGEGTVSKIREIRILVLNVRATGAEICKNLCLSSPLNLTIIDDSKITEKDLKFNYFVNKDDIGKSRSVNMKEKLSRLNKFVKIKTTTFENLTPEYIKKFNIFFATDFYDQKLLESWNSECRKVGIGFISTGCIGTFCHLFVDFCDHKVIEPIRQDKIRQFFIEDISNSSPGVVTVSKSNPLYLKDGDFVSIMGVKGMEDVNGTEVRPVKVIDEYTFTIENTKAYGKYSGGGYVNHEMVPYSKTFSSFSRSLVEPKLVDIPPSKLSQVEMHVTLMLFYDWRAYLENSPHTLEGKTDEELEQIAMEICLENPTIEIIQKNHKLDISKVTSLLVSFIKFGEFQLVPVAHLIANLASFQFVVFNGKFSPIYQEVYINFDEFNSNFSDFLGTRDIQTVSQYFELGHEAMDFRNMKIGIFGCGSKGTETSKLCCLLGIGSEGNGELFLIDDKKIKVSNLASCCMFNEDDIGKFKSITLKEKILKKYPERKVTAFAEHVVFGEKYLNDALIQDLDLIFAAMDDSTFQLKMIERAQKFNKPLIILNSDDLQVTIHSVIPTGNKQDLENYQTFLREEVQKKLNRGEELLKYPCLSSHCVEWAKSRFSTFFSRMYQRLNEFQQDPCSFFEKLSEVCEDDEEMIEQMSDYLELIRDLFVESTINNYSDCVDIAIHLFYQYFTAEINELLAEHPEDEKISGEQSFWNEIRRCPQAVSIRELTFFDNCNQKFVESCSNLLCQFFKLNIPNQQIAREIVINKIKAFDINEEQRTKIRPAEFKKTVEKLKKMILNLKEKPSWSLVQVHTTDKHPDFAEDIEKFIYSASNLRAKNFGLKEIGEFEFKQMALNIPQILVMVSSMPACLAIIDAIKLCVKSNEEKFRVPHISPCEGIVEFERNPDLKMRMKASFTQVSSNKQSPTGSSVNREEGDEAEFQMQIEGEQASDQNA